jgi:hypothetical protein
MAHSGYSVLQQQQQQQEQVCQVCQTAAVLQDLPQPGVPVLLATTRAIVTTDQRRA